MNTWLANGPERLLRLTLLALLLALPAAGLWAENPSAHGYFTDIELIDQHGKTQRLYSDLIQDKVVLVNAFFTSCTGSCPVMAGHLVKVQDWLGERLGKEVYIVSVSVDPATDSQAKLAEYAERFGAREGWYFLSGEPANVEAALRKLGQYVDEPEAHTSVMMIGNDRTSLWKKVQGLSQPKQLIAVLDSVINDVMPEPPTDPPAGR